MSRYPAVACKHGLPYASRVGDLLAGTQARRCALLEVTTCDVRSPRRSPMTPRTAPAPEMGSETVDHSGPADGGGDGSPSPTPLSGAPTRPYGHPAHLHYRQVGSSHQPVPIVTDDFEVLHAAQSTIRSRTEQRQRNDADTVAAAVRVGRDDPLVAGERRRLDTAGPPGRQPAIEEELAQRRVAGVGYRSFGGLEPMQASKGPPPDRRLGPFGPIQMNGFLTTLISSPHAGTGGAGQAR